MQGIPNVNKTAETIAHGSHKYNEATRKYVEVSPLELITEYPRAMWHHGKKQYAEAHSQIEQQHMESEGWQTKPWAEAVVAKDTVVAHPVNLAEVVLQQELEMKELKAKLEKMLAPEEKRGPGRPPKVQVED